MDLVLNYQDDNMEANVEENEEVYKVFGTKSGESKSPRLDPLIKNLDTKQTSDLLFEMSRVANNEVESGYELPPQEKIEKNPLWASFLVNPGLATNSIFSVSFL